MSLRNYLLAAAICLLMPLGGLYAQVRLPQLVADSMVLQRNTRITLWGWAKAGERITINFKGSTYKTTADNSGNWKTALPPHKPGGPYTMKIDASNHILLKDIYIGDVWFCTGQSNMVLPMERVKERYPEEIAKANYPQIRNFFIPTVSDVRKPHDDLPPSHWVAASPVNILQFGAASWFMAKKLYDRYHVPIGIINSSVGGTPIQAWISADAIKAFPEYQTRLNQLKDTAYFNRITKSIAPPPSKIVKDKGLTEDKKWFDTTYIPKAWHQFWLPGYWADQGVRNLNGVVWFRKEIILPASAAGKPAKLFLGRMIDADQTYVNGAEVGNITYQYPPRRYNIPAGLLKAGKNIIVVRLINYSGKGGFVPDKPYFMAIDNEKIDLRGDWQYKVGEVYRSSSNPVTTLSPFSAQNEPTGLYNTMVAPVLNYAVKGIVWYQGESNISKPEEYAQLLPALLNDWREKFQQGVLPFLCVQLPNFGEVEYSPAKSPWAVVREAQLKVLSLPYTGLAVAIDAGEWNDIHPLDKKDVGDRLALVAETVAYGDKNLVGSGPIFESAKIEGNKIIISFTNTGSGLVAKGGGKLEQFAIAGEDKKFVWANATIEGNKVIVSSDEIAEPKYVRYAWADNPQGANLYNQEGLPASPFRTDTGKQ